MTARKQYSAPRLKAYQVKPIKIICASGEPKGTSNEQYETGETSGWIWNN